MIGINYALVKVAICYKLMNVNVESIEIQMKNWRRRHLSMGNGFDLSICQYRLISKKLNLHQVRENLRMIAILKKNGLGMINYGAELTEVNICQNGFYIKQKHILINYFHKLRNNKWNIHYRKNNY